MNKARFLAQLIIAFALVGLVTACENGPTTRPSSIGREPSSQTVFPNRVEILGPDSVPPGGSAKLTATAQMSDGSSRDVTSDAAWTTSDPSVLDVSGGRVTGGTRGETTIRVSYRGFTDARVMFAMPRGTYRLMGVVREAGGALEGALVEVLTGAGTGLSATTNELGQYRIYGVAGDTQIRVTRADYEVEVQSMDINANRELNVELRPCRPNPSFARAGQTESRPHTSVSVDPGPSTIRNTSLIGPIWISSP